MNHHEAVTELRAGNVRPVYLLYGGEPFLEEEVFAAIRDATVRAETADFNFHVIDPGNDQIQKAISMARTEPFFAERRLVVVRDCPAFAATRKKQEESESAGEEEEPRSSGDELLMQYLKAPAASTCLVFQVGENVDSRKKATKAVLQLGGAVECKPLKPDDAAMWAQRRATAIGKKLNDAGARMLVEKTGTDLRLIDSELQKLALYVGDGKQIGPADVDAVVSGMAETEIFRLTEAVMLKERSKALALLAKLLLQVDHPLQLLAALTNRFRQVLTVKALVARGVSPREGAGLARMHPYAYEKMAGHVRSFPRTEIIRAMERLLAADMGIKSGQDPKLTMETLVVDLTREIES